MNSRTTMQIAGWAALALASTVAAQSAPEDTTSPPPIPVPAHHAAAKPTSAGHAAMDHSGMNHDSMDHDGMDHDGHGMAAGPLLPPITPAMRGAAFPDLGGMSMSEHMHADPLVGMLLFDRLEAQPGDGPTPLAWDLRAWLGHDSNRLWLRSEGERVAGHTEHGDLSLLWGRPLTPWWDLVAGVRSDLGAGPSRQWAAFGVQGMAPYKFEVEATAYVGAGGRLAARLEAEYELLLTQRLILQPRAEANLYSRSDTLRGVGAGLDDIEAGLRLRYELRREVAPYVGIEQVRRFGRSADLTREAGEPSTETRWVAGLRLWW
ncbi:MAG TPA: copper resistance protein B [Rhodanobacteraceae bacterium]|nr:copper resistance protein B [Rhodanobacteraceae bacterium]